MHPMADLEVIGLTNKAKITALVDTGFSGALCIPLKTAKDLGLVLCGEEKFELGNGQWMTQFLFKGQVKFLGEIREVDIVVSDSETSQLGIQLLADCKLTIDFLSNKISLSRRRI